MTLYDKRCFVSSFRHHGIAVVTFVQRNVRTGAWEIEFCNSVTKDQVNGFAPIIAGSRQEAITKLGITHGHKKTY